LGHMECHLLLIIVLDPSLQKFWLVNQI